MTREKFDAIVLGAGAMGSAAAYHLARDGHRVLLLEQFEIAHDRGSTHGESRIFRFAYPELAYARLAIDCRTLWQQLAAEAAEPILIPVGGLDIGEGEVGRRDVTGVLNSLKALHCDFEELDYPALMRRFPQWRVDEDTITVYSPDTGVINPTRAIQVMVARAIAHGAEVQDRESVIKIAPTAGGEVEVVSSRDRYQAKWLIVTAGAWSKRLLSELNLSLPLRVSQEQTVYFQPRIRIEDFMPEKFKVWIHYRDEIVYGIPVLGRGGIKLGFHHDHHYLDIDDYRQQPSAAVTARLRAYLERYLPDAAGEDYAAATCLYTNTPDQNFIVDRVPGFPQIAFGAGFSGHGFKFAIGIGRALADLVVQGQTSLEIEHIRLKSLI